MGGRVDLNGGAEQREVSNSHLAHVEHDTVEVEEDQLAE
jgi:hypothetical protein